MEEKHLKTPEEQAQRDALSHHQHRKRMRERYNAEGLVGMEPHQVLEMLLFDIHPRCDTNPIAHRLLEEYGSLSAVLRGDRTVPGAGERTVAFLQETDLELQKLFLEALDREAVLDKDQFPIIAAWMNRRFPDHALVLLCDETGHFRELQPVETADLSRIAEVLLPVMPENWVCHLAYAENSTEKGEEAERKIRNLRRYFCRNNRELGWVLEIRSHLEFQWME